MKICHCKRFQKLHLFSLSTPTGSKIGVIFSVGVKFSKIQADFQNCHIWAWNLEFENSIISYMSLFSLYGQRFPRYWSIFKIYCPKLGHETWNWKKVPEIAYAPTFYPEWSQTELVFALQAAFSEKRDVVRNFCYCPSYMVKKSPHLCQELNCCQTVRIILILTPG